jgi:hypothetical protein
MKKTDDHLEVLQENKVNTRRVKTPNVKGGKYRGNPYMKLKKVKTEPRQKIRQLLKSSISPEELKQVTGVAQVKN